MPMPMRVAMSMRAVRAGTAMSTTQVMPAAAAGSCAAPEHLKIYNPHFVKTKCDEEQMRRISPKEAHATCRRKKLHKYRVILLTRKSCFVF